MKLRKKKKERLKTLFQVSLWEYVLYDVHMCSHVYRCTQMCACEGLRLISSISSDCSLPYLLRRDLLLNLVLTVWASLTSQLDSEVPPPSRPTQLSTGFWDRNCGPQLV